VATDTIYSDTLAIDCGFTSAQLLVGTKTHTADDALEQFADNPDSVIDLVVYHANRARYVCDHETVEAAPKFVMTSEPAYGQLRPRVYYSTHTHAHEYYTQ
jgi:hypothetical protein